MMAVSFSALGPGGTAIAAALLVTVSWMACWCSWGSVIAMSRGWVPSRGAVHGLCGPVGISLLLVRTRKHKVPVKEKAQLTAHSFRALPRHAIPTRATEAASAPNAVAPPPPPAFSAGAWPSPVPAVSPPALEGVPALATVPAASPAAGAAGRVPKHIGLGSSLVAALLLLAALGSLYLGWVDALSPEQAQAIDERISSALHVTGTVGTQEITVDPTLIPQMDPDQYVRISGWSLGVVGHLLAILSACGVALAVFAGWNRLPGLHLVLAVLAATVTTVLALAMSVIEWINLRRLPFADRLPQELQSYLPDSHAGPGLWLYVLATAFTAVLIARAAVGSYHDRYGLAWSKLQR